MYQLYRKLPSGKWKYSEVYYSTLDPNYHADINYLNNKNIAWELRDLQGNVKFKSD